MCMTQECQRKIYKIALEAQYVPKVVDPVCGMEIDTGTAKFKTVYRGKIYYFCSDRCRSEFERNPELYLSSGPTGMPAR